MGEPEVVEILVRLVRKFDVMLVQEIVDVTGKSVESLLQKVNLHREGAGVLLFVHIRKSVKCDL